MCQTASETENTFGLDFKIISQQNKITLSTVSHFFIINLSDFYHPHAEFNELFLEDSLVFCLDLIVCHPDQKPGTEISKIQIHNILKDVMVC
jgi:hypothetical protein